MTKITETRLPPMSAETDPSARLYDETDVVGAASAFASHEVIDPIDYRPSPEQEGEGRRYSAVNLAVELAKTGKLEGTVLDTAREIEIFLRGTEGKSE